MRLIATTAVAAGVVNAPALAQTVPVEITVENLAPANGVAFAPFRFGFSNGTFDSFDDGQEAFLLGEPDVASAPITSIAEGGSGDTWFPAFQAAEPDANLGSILGPTIPPILPGQSGSTVIDVDLSNPFLIFGSMVVPSNDHFIGNDDPKGLRVLNPDGTLALSGFSQFGRSIWDNGSEAEIAENAAFLQVGTNAQRVDENGVVEFDFDGLSTFDGLTTSPGYNFDFSTLSADGEILRVSFAIVPEPATAGLALVAAPVLLRRRRG